MSKSTVEASRPHRLAREKAPEPGGPRPGRWIGRLQALLGIVLFVVAAFAVWRFLRGTPPDRILDAIARVPGSAVALALAAAAANYLVLTGYDALGLLYLRRPLRWRRLAAVSFVAYTMSHNLGMSLLSGGAARVRFYARYGLGVVEATTVAVFCNLTFWIGFLFVGGVVFTLRPPAVPADLGLPLADLRPVGLAMLAAIGALFLWLAGGDRTVEIGGRTLRLPSGSMLLAQIAVSAADWLLAALVLHLLLPLGAFPDTLALFLLAQVAAMASNVPGGMGVFEWVVLYATAGDLDPADTLGRLIVYRFVYYFVPLCLALAIMAVLSRGRRTAD